MVPQEHTLRAFDVDIAGMRRAVQEMGALAERQVRRAVEALLNADTGLGAQVLAEERTLNALHVQIDELCNRIIALRQPIAIDLREVIGVIHTINDLERIGDEAKKIALKARTLPADLMLDLRPRLTVMVDQAADMVHRAVDGFLRHDATVAAELGVSDDAVDALRDELVDALMARMSLYPQHVAATLDLILAVQSVERVADHAESIAEYVVHVVQGVDMRHGSQPR